MKSVGTCTSETWLEQYFRATEAFGANSDDVSQHVGLGLEEFLLSELPLFDAHKEISVSAPLFGFGQSLWQSHPQLTLSCRLHGELRHCFCTDDVSS